MSLHLLDNLPTVYTDLLKDTLRLAREEITLHEFYMDQRPVEKEQDITFMIIVAVAGLAMVPFQILEGWFWSTILIIPLSVIVPALAIWMIIDPNFVPNYVFVVKGTEWWIDWIITPTMRWIKNSLIPITWIL